MNGIKKINIHPSAIRGRGVYAYTAFEVGEKIAYFEGYMINHSTQYSLFLVGKHIEPTGPLKQLNHSCLPNAIFSGRWLVASLNIQEGEEITIDYEETELMISHPFHCKCAKPNCRKIIGAMKQLTKNSRGTSASPLPLN